ncbi:MAG TPA: ATP-binding cassette domain-containing protein [Pyrinomonadaceae bacterium]|nr:ATP-binding cassette domain-containing protein [Pyrinomonadaceae bacterium]
MGTADRHLQPPAVEFRNVSLSFDELQVLDNVSFKLGRGEMVFLTGVSGSGKSVLLHIAIGLLQPDEGQVFVEGREIKTLDETELLAIRGGRMGMVFQSDSLFSGLSVYDNAAFRLVEHGVTAEKTDAAVREVLRFVGLENDAEKFPAELSGGMRRRLEIARAVIGWPSIMFFDEPTQSLDPITATQIMNLAIRARDVFGMSSIYVTKRLDEFSYLASHTAAVRNDGPVTISKVSRAITPPRTRILVLDSGRIVFAGSVAEFETSSLSVVTRLTQADNGTVFSDYNPPDPWDKKRKPREAIL